MCRGGDGRGFGCLDGGGVLGFCVGFDMHPSGALVAQVLTRSHWVGIFNLQPSVPLHLAFIGRGEEIAGLVHPLSYWNIVVLGWPWVVVVHDGAEKL